VIRSAEEGGWQAWDRRLTTCGIPSPQSDRARHGYRPRWRGPFRVSSAGNQRFERSGVVTCEPLRLVGMEGRKLRTPDLVA
jgi:hypothetical protein